MVILLLSALLPLHAQQRPKRTLVYLVSDLRIPFWQIMARGIRERAGTLGYDMVVYSAENSTKTELENAVRAIKANSAGIIVSPTSSSACMTVLKLAARSQIPVVISDVGTDGGQFVSYVSSDNFTGAYEIGRVLAEAMHRRGWQHGSVGVIAIPQKRDNGKERTEGFMKAMEEEGIKGAGLYQQADFSYKETYTFTRTLILENPDLRALWLQGSNRYQAALDAIADAGKTGEILLVCFDAEPEFLQMIPEGKLVGAAMQQPFLMGEEAVKLMDAHLHGKPAKREAKLPILAVSSENLPCNLPTIRRNVLGITDDQGVHP